MNTLTSISTLAEVRAVSSPSMARRGFNALWRWPGKEATLLFMGLLLAWQLGATFFTSAANSLLPAPLRVAQALWESLPELWVGTWSSLLILLPGYLAAVVTGVVAGLWVATTPGLRRAFFPFARVVAPVPPTVYIPYAIALLPTFLLSAMFVVFIGAFWPIFQSAAAGALTVEGRYRDNARVLGLTHREYLCKVVFPASLPHIFSGMAVGLAFAFILLTVAELFGANAGLGRFVQYYADFADYPRMVAGILYTGLVTFLSLSLLEYIRHRALFWLK
ncbi:MAG TPA: ABC transporter permease [Candidatus Competibacteraceae bacterium]|nr:ABC transporter permease [Candidatus Competibacteraceae bacterium]HRZ06618.1 ABC transporter permease [Candidatus Competibacteraceae bacterium]HSA46804.1 ABC transporter permease [Candidatus Competibacteraceae bacterium]